MDKPLKDWTLGEIQKAAVENKELNCDGCPLQGDFCGKLFAECAINWELKTQPRWTEQEREDAKTLLRMFHGVYEYIHRYGSGLCMMVKEDSVAGIPMEPTLFPSLQEGETVNLSEIAGCEE